MHGWMKFILVVVVVGLLAMVFREHIPGLASNDGDETADDAAQVDAAPVEAIRETNDGRSTSRATEASQTSDLSRSVGTQDTRQSGMAATARANEKRRQSREAVERMENEEGGGDEE